MRLPSCSSNGTVPPGLTRRTSGVIPPSSLITTSSTSSPARWTGSQPRMLHEEKRLLPITSLPRAIAAPCRCPPKART
jgi:hypothetical protein